VDDASGADGIGNDPADLMPNPSQGRSQLPQA
jgi:hypothetical protein